MSVDTPDYQRGVVAAQKLLATVPAGTDLVTVGVPPNTETLVVVGGDPTSMATAMCFDTANGMQYVGRRVQSPGLDPVNFTWFFDVSAAVSQQASVALGGEPTAAWTVYSDTGTHIVVDVGRATDISGAQYVVPTAPSRFSGDHPPVELLAASSIFTGNTSFIAAPAAGERLRLFHLSAGIYGGSGACNIVESVTGTVVAWVGGGAPLDLPFTPSGLPLTAENGLFTNQAQGNTSWYINAVYTVETV